MQTGVASAVIMSLPSEVCIWFSSFRRPCQYNRNKMIDNYHHHIAWCIVQCIRQYDDDYCLSCTVHQAIWWWLLSAMYSASGNIMMIIVCHVQCIRQYDDDYCLPCTVHQAIWWWLLSAMYSASGNMMMIIVCHVQCIRQYDDDYCLPFYSYIMVIAFLCHYLHINSQG